MKFSENALSIPLTREQFGRRNKKFRLHSFPLLTCRPFIFKDVDLSDLREKDLFGRLNDVMAKVLAIDVPAYIAERLTDWKSSVAKIEALDDSCKVRAPLFPVIACDHTGSSGGGATRRH